MTQSEDESLVVGGKAYYIDIFYFAAISDCIKKAIPNGMAFRFYLNDIQLFCIFCHYLVLLAQESVSNRSSDED